MNKMKAARLFSIGDFKTVNIPIPEPKGKQLLVKIGACGVCGSDIPRIYQHGTSNGIYPLTLGHEFSGQIVQVASHDDASLVGKVGSFFPLIPCMKCDNCRSGHYTMCNDYDYMGSRCDGGFAEYCLVPSSWYFVESHNPHADYETLCMLEPACVAQHAVRKAGVFTGSNVLIYGAGPIGIMAARWATIAGSTKVVMVDVNDIKANFSLNHGFECINSCKEGFINKVLDHFEGKLADIVIEGTGYSSALENAILTVKGHGRITLLGNPASQTTISLKAHSLILRKELEINGIWNSNYSSEPINEWRYAVDMMDSLKFKCKDLISNRVSLDDLPMLLEMMAHHEISTCKVIYSAQA